MKSKKGEKEYFSLIQEMRESTYKSNAWKVIEELDRLFEIKPVRTIWYVAKAEAMIQAGCNTDEIYQLLDSKTNTLYNYENLEDIIKVYISLAELTNDDEEKKHWMYTWGNVCKEAPEDCQQVIGEVNKRIKVLYEAFLGGTYTEGSLLEMMSLCYVQKDYVMQYLLDYLYRELHGGETQIRDRIKRKKNIGYLDLMLDKNESNTFIVLAESNEDFAMGSVATNILGMLHQKVYFLDAPLVVEVEEKIDLKATLEISMSNTEERGNYTVIHPVAVVYQGEVIGDNRDYIVNHICRSFCPNEHVSVLCSGFLMDDLCQRDLLRKHTGRLFDYIDEFTEDKLTFGWSGDYLSYIEKIYCMDVREKIEKRAECDFSIVVPVRNNAYTLRSMLKTCLDQTYTGSFEVVVSDNSTEGNYEIEELCREIADQRLVYVKTPRDLHLTKSFEYALLNARGKYIIPIGADDGVLPWALSTLADIEKQYPEAEIIQWQRGFYAWPGFNGSQEHQFVIPAEYKKGDYNVKFLSMPQYIGKVIVRLQSVYSLPLLYINSCFRRSYFKRLLEKTGRMWDGASQDVYMGVITACIQEKVLNIDYPLTIAGMSSSSIGASTVKNKSALKDYKQIDKERTTLNNIGGYCFTYLERFLPEVGNDACAFYGALLRAIALGILPEEIISETLDWKKIIEQSGKQISGTLIWYDRVAHELRYDAAKWGPEFLKWFDEEVFGEMMSPKKILEKQQQGKGPGYITGKREDGSMVLDASEYGVKDIAGAVKLFAKLTEL